MLLDLKHIENSKILIGEILFPVMNAYVVAVVFVLVVHQY